MKPGPRREIRFRVRGEIEDVAVGVVRVPDLTETHFEPLPLRRMKQAGLDIIAASLHTSRPDFE